MRYDTQYINWFAGLYEGEGSTTVIENRMLQTAIKMCDLDVLEKIRGGKITGPYKGKKENWRPYYCWRVHDEFMLLLRILPLLGKRRQNQIADAFKKRGVAYMLPDAISDNIAEKSINDYF